MDPSGVGDYRAREWDLQHGVSEPTNVELHPPLSSLVVFKVLRIPWLIVVAVERSPNLTALAPLEFLLVKSDCPRMRENKRFADGPGLSSRIANGTGFVCSASTGSIDAISITLKID